MKMQTKRKIKWVGLILLLLVLLGVIGFLAAEAVGRNAMTGKTDDSIEVTAPEIEDVEVEKDGEFVTYKGEKYRYNENITSVLCMGVDERELADEDAQIGEAGQADMLMLAILDTKTGDVKLWNISRDSMTDVDIYNVEGEYVRTEEMQACLAFAYGDGSHESCENTVRAVSRLLYGMPIQSYAVLHMDALEPLNDAIGGVEVKIHEGDILPARFKPGTTVLLKGNDVENYVRTRNIDWTTNGALDSNNNRMERQRQYMMNFIQKVLRMTKEDISTPLNLFNIARKGQYIITNLNVSRVTYLTTVLSRINFTEESFQTIPGEVVAGEKYAEYHVDDEALYQMILDTFYTKE